MLQYLESALLDDDDDEGGELSGSLDEGHDPLSEASWADTLEELLAAENGSPTTECSSETSAATQSEHGEQCRRGSSTGYVGTMTGRVRQRHLGCV